MSYSVYDSWFDETLPRAQFDSLQCWIENENTGKWSTEVDITIHSFLYDLATKNGLILGGTEEIIPV